MMELNDWYFLWILYYILCLFSIYIGVSFILIMFFINYVNYFCVSCYLFCLNLKKIYIKIE